MEFCQRIVRSGQHCKRPANHFGPEGRFCSWHNLMRLALILALCSSGFAATVRVSCGGPGGVDASGNVWQGDGPYFTGGATWAMPGQQFPYSNLRFSNPAGSQFSYSIPVNPPLTAGQYIVTLKFSEPTVTAIGKRRFSVSINGVKVITDLDLFAVAGLLKPYDLTFPVTASGVISVVLTPTSSTDKAVISAIQIDAVLPTPTLPIVFLIGTEKPPPGPPPCPLAGLAFFFATDTSHLYWCSTAFDGVWHTVGDVRNASYGTMGSPALIGLLDKDGNALMESCSGGLVVWNCVGLWHAQSVTTGGLYAPLGAWTVQLAAK
jgi:hypothetical protein